MLARECLSEFKLDCQLRRLSNRTIKSYHNNVALFLNYLETKFELYELEDIKAPHLKSYFQYLLDKQLSPSYANGILKSIRAFFRFAHAEEYLLQNPALKVRWQKEGIVLIKTFTDEEVRRLIYAFDGRSFLSMRNKLIIALAFDTGARNAEICDIKNCDIKDNLLLLHGKGNKERYIPLTPYINKLINKYDRMKEHYFLDKRKNSDCYFLSRTGRKLTREALENVFNQANDVAKVRSTIRCSPHTARHYYAQTNLRNGLDVYSLSRLLGHENINITKRYLQSLEDESIVTMAVNTSPLMNMRL